MIDPHNGAFDQVEGDHVLIRRRDAAQATLDEWRNQRLRLGYADCARMVASHLRRMGHKARVPARGTYRTPRSAVAALAKLGHADLAAAIDALDLPRIAPAAALVGDIVQMPSEVEGLGALTVAMGNGRVAGWHGEDGPGVIVMQPLQVVTAWRVNPKD